MSECTETAETIHNRDKVAVAEHLRLMADNQKDLDMVNASDARSRDLTARLADAQAAQQFPHIAGPSPPREAEEVKINVDSPTTTNHNYPPPSAPQPVAKPMGALGKAAIAAWLLGSGAAIPWAVGLIGGSAPPPAVDADTQYESQIEVE